MVERLERAGNIEHFDEHYKVFLSQFSEEMLPIWAASRKNSAFFDAYSHKLGSWTADLVIEQCKGTYSGEDQQSQELCDLVQLSIELTTCKSSVKCISELFAEACLVMERRTNRLLTEMSIEDDFEIS